jgi:hypothetical protein
MMFLVFMRVDPIAGGPPVVKDKPVPGRFAIS